MFARIIVFLDLSNLTSDKFAANPKANKCSKHTWPTHYAQILDKASKLMERDVHSSVKNNPQIVFISKKNWVKMAKIYFELTILKLIA